MRVYFDASVLIAALLSPTGGAALLTKGVKSGHIHGIISQTIIDEVTNKSAKIARSQEEIDYFIAENGFIVRKRLSNQEIAPYITQVDKTDAHVIAGGILTNCKYIVTLDKIHLLRPNICDMFLPMKIVSTKTLITTLVEDNDSLKK